MIFILREYILQQVMYQNWVSYWDDTVTCSIKVMIKLSSNLNVGSCSASSQAPSQKGLRSWGQPSLPRLHTHRVLSYYEGLESDASGPGRIRTCPNRPSLLRRGPWAELFSGWENPSNGISAGAGLRERRSLGLSARTYIFCRYKESFHSIIRNLNGEGEHPG